MKLSALCCTHNRPHYLGELIECFLRQDYPEHQRELIILDDAGQYGNIEGEGWKIISVKTRFASLGEKRNACAALVSADSEGLLVADDDDLYFPHWFSAHAEALKRGDWSCPSLIYTENDGLLQTGSTGGIFHGAHAFRREIFRKLQGYKALNSGEDQEIFSRFHEAEVVKNDPCEQFPPFYVYRFRGDTSHLSAMDDVDGYRLLGERKMEDVGLFSVAWKRNYNEWLSESIRKEAKKFQLVGPVNEPTGDGPFNGMYALQKSLRQIGSDILEIAPPPIRKGCIPWFWFCGSRKMAARYAKANLPFIQGPNMVFDNSFSPRGGPYEPEILDSPACLLHITHPGWYLEHVRKHLGPDNPGNMLSIPYPIDPLPDEPEEAEYDLLIYKKSNAYPELIASAQHKYPRNILVEYGHFLRLDLYEKARKSRCCLYVCNDESGGLAAQEIMLSGCPIIGIKRGSPLIIDGQTGLYLDTEVSTDTFSTIPEDSLWESLEKVMSWNRSEVREAAIQEFDGEQIARKVLETLKNVLQSLQA